MEIKRALRLSPGRIQEGEVGIEVELEFESHDVPTPPPEWRLEHDGSLRGTAGEYVLRAPLAREVVEGSLDALYDHVKDAGLKNSANAGVHIHVNIQEMDVVEAINFITLYLIFEEPLVRFCGESRESNLFCLRVIDAEGLIEHLESAIRSRNLRNLNTDEIRYSSLNLKAIAQYGSLEFRAMRSDGNFEIIKQWVEILLSLKDAASNYKNPIQILESISFDGIDGMANNVLGEHSGLVTKMPNYNNIVMNGIRNLQDYVYCTDWERWREKMEESLPRTSDVSIDFHALPLQVLEQTDDYRVSYRPGSRMFSYLFENGFCYEIAARFCDEAGALIHSRALQLYCDREGSMPHESNLYTLWRSDAEYREAYGDVSGGDVPLFLEEDEDEELDMDDEENSNGGYHT